MFLSRRLVHLQQLQWTRHERLRPTCNSRRRTRKADLRQLSRTFSADLPSHLPPEVALGPTLPSPPLPLPLSHPSLAPPDKTSNQKIAGAQAGHSSRNQTKTISEGANSQSADRSCPDIPRACTPFQRYFLLIVVHFSARRLALQLYK